MPNLGTLSLLKRALQVGQNRGFGLNPSRQTT